MMKLTYFISIFYITLCLPAHLFAALSKTTDQNENADINAKNVNGETLLMLASQNDHLNRVQELLSLNADPNIQGRYGDTALIIAASNGNLNIVKKLCNYNADPNLQKDSCYTALMWAACFNRLDIIQELCKNNADPNKQNRDGQTALMMAISIWGGNPNIIKELCNYNAKPNIRDKNGKTALDLAKEKFSNHTQIIRILEQAGYSTHPNIQKDDIIIADDLITPCGYGNVNRVKEIVNKNWFNNKTHPALDFAKAILSDYKQIIIILEEAECNAKPKKVTNSECSQTETTQENSYSVIQNSYCAIHDCVVQ